MNRIKELREARGISAVKLAEKLGTTQSQVWRLEAGERKLTEDWMRRIAKALDVRPSELLAAVTLAEFEDEAEPYIHPDLATIGEPLKSRNLFFYKVISDAVERAGVPRGKVVLFDMSTEAVAARKTGDIVLVSIFPDKDEKRGISLVRQFVAPGLFLTNRAGLNTTFQEKGETFQVAVRGVMVPDPNPSGSRQ